MLDRSSPPVSNSVKRFDFAKAITLTTSNGIPLHVINSGNHDIIRLEIIFKSGKWIEKIIGSSYFCSKLLSEGSKGRTSHEISEFFDQYGAFFQAHPGMDYVNFSLYSLNRYLDLLLPVVYEILTEPAFPEEELITQKNIKIQQIRVNEEKNSFLASRNYKKLIFGEEHPYGTDLAIESIVNDINREILIDFYGDHLISSPEIIVSGKITDRDIDRIISVFNRMDYHHIEIPEKNHDYYKSERLNISKDDSVQVSLRYGKPIVNKGHKDFIDLLILNEIFGGYFGSRLMKSIREEKGYTYGIYSSIINMIHDAYFVIASDVKKEFAEKVVEDIDNEIIRLQNKPVDDIELDTVRNYMAGTFLSSLETSFALADKFKSIHFYDLDYSYYDTYLDRISNITSQRIRELANQYLTPENFSLVTVG
jgi:zinc protease